jgi:hypothetical protein
VEIVSRHARYAMPTDAKPVKPNGKVNFGPMNGVRISPGPGARMRSPFG